MRLVVRCTLVAALLGWVGAVQAIANCTTSASATAFGSYDPFSAGPNDSAGNVQVQCSLLGILSIAVNYTIELSAGGSGSFADRRMTGGAATLRYGLYVNAARTSVWGDGSAGTSTVSDGYLLGLLTTTRNYPVYGRVIAGQNVAPATYTDTIAVTVNY